MNVYIYQADLYCPSCARRIKRRLASEGKRPAEFQDEFTFDSDDFPKGPYPEGGGEADIPQHCASGEDCLDPLILDGEKYGAFLGNDLTSDGIEYVKDVVENRGGKVAQFWAEVYSDELAGV